MNKLLLGYCGDLSDGGNFFWVSFIDSSEVCVYFMIVFVIICGCFE